MVGRAWEMKQTLLVSVGESSLEHSVMCTLILVTMTSVRITQHVLIRLDHFTAIVSHYTLANSVKF